MNIAFNFGPKSLEMLTMTRSAVITYFYFIFMYFDNRLKRT